MREGIELSTGFTASVDIKLSVGDIAETITVSGASPVVDIQNVEQRAVMDREMIDSIPSGKSISSYGLLVPGMTVAEPHTRCPDGLPVPQRQRGTQRYSGGPS